MPGGPCRAQSTKQRQAQGAWERPSGTCLVSLARPAAASARIWGAALAGNWPARERTRRVVPTRSPERVRWRAGRPLAVIAPDYRQASLTEVGAVRPRQDAAWRARAGGAAPGAARPSYRRA